MLVKVGDNGIYGFLVVAVDGNRGKCGPIGNDVKGHMTMDENIFQTFPMARQNHIESQSEALVLVWTHCQLDNSRWYLRQHNIPRGSDAQQVNICDRGKNVSQLTFPRNTQMVD